MKYVVAPGCEAAHYAPVNAGRCMMPRLLSLDRFLVHLLALLAFVVLACDATAQSTAYSQGLLWKIEGRAREPSYVFGTDHVSDPRVTALPEPVRKSFDSAGTVAIEVTLDAANIVQLLDRMIYKDSRDLQTAIGAPLYRRVVAAAADIGLPSEVLQRLRPWAVGLFLSMPPSDPQNVLDFMLQRRALEQKKNVQALETVDEQVATLDGMSEREQVDFMRRALDNRERLPAIVERTLGAYLRRDLAALFRISAEESGDAASQALSATLLQRLLYDRNARMAQRAQPLIDAGSTFVAVGALHLYGDRGVLAELARRGYRVSRVY
jgi:uncharacterized protein YbaP (TraB family)